VRPTSAPAPTALQPRERLAHRMVRKFAPAAIQVIMRTAVPVRPTSAPAPTALQPRERLAHRMVRKFAPAATQTMNLTPATLVQIRPQP